ncbi:MAG: hypothetical protein Q8Q23_03875 [bacterium]|nr:hypothetical protein [bacterium]
MESIKKTNQEQTSQQQAKKPRNDFFMPDAELFKQAGEELRANKKIQKSIARVIKGPIPKY